MTPILPSLLVAIASREIGTTEVDGTNCGLRVNEYKSATWLDPYRGWPWCAAFVCWCVREAMKTGGRQWTFKRPMTAGAFDFENWSRAQDDSTWTKKPAGTDILPGDIVIYKFSHIGISVTRPDKNNNFLAVEGNTDSSGSREGGGVFRKQRRLVQVRSRIRFRV